MSRRERILLALASVLLVYAAWQFWPSAPSKPSGAVASVAGAKAAKAAPVDILTPFRKDLYDKPQPVPKGESRNPFAYGVIKPVIDPEVERLRAEAERRRQEDEAARAQAAQALAEAQPPPPPPRPTFPYPFMGYVGPRGSEHAVFRDSKGYFYARRGEIIQEQFQVMEIGYESVELRYVGTTETVRIGLAETAKR